LNIITEIWQSNYKNKVINTNNNNSESEDNELYLHIIKKRKINNDDELQNYLKEPTVKGKTNILQWWNIHKIQYPNLAKMAQDFLAIPGKYKYKL
jgi:hAT family C-terminal dimerisation region